MLHLLHLQLSFQSCQEPQKNRPSLTQGVPLTAEIQQEHSP